MDDRSAVAAAGYYPGRPNEKTIQTMKMVRDKFAELAVCLTDSLPPGRHTALAHTALEEAAMWATKALSHAPENQSEDSV